MLRFVYLLLRCTNVSKRIVSNDDSNYLFLLILYDKNDETTFKNYKYSTTWYQFEQMRGLFLRYNTDVIKMFSILISHMPKDCQDEHLFLEVNTKNMNGLWFKEVIVEIILSRVVKENGSICMDEERRVGE